MHTKLILPLLFICMVFQQNRASAQQAAIDSMLSLLTVQKADSDKVNTLNALSKAYRNNFPDSGMLYAQKAFDLAKKSDFQKGAGRAYLNMGAIADIDGNFHHALQYNDSAIVIAKAVGDRKLEGNAYNNIGVLYNKQGNFPKGLEYIFKSQEINVALDYKQGIANTFLNIGNIYFNHDKYPQALENYLKSLKVSEDFGIKGVAGLASNGIGNVYNKQGDYARALDYYFKSLKISEEIQNTGSAGAAYNNIGILYNFQKLYQKGLEYGLKALSTARQVNDKRDEGFALTTVAQSYHGLKNYSEALKHAREALSVAQNGGFKKQANTASESLAGISEAMGDYKMAYEYSRLNHAYTDSLNAEEEIKKFTRLEMQHDFDKQQDSIATAQKLADARHAGDLQRARTTRSAYLAGFGLMAIIAFLLWNRYRIKQRANKQLTQTLTELKNTQEQLVKSEKMAAFGVIASRVAHEIQNPLNFVNNFSELSEDLVRDIVSSGNEQERKETAKPLLDNLQKINHHGKRAATIVKELQEHTLKGTAQEFFETKQQ